MKVLSNASRREAGGYRAITIDRYGASFVRALKDAYSPYKDRGDNTELSEEFRLPLLYPYEIQHRELETATTERTPEEIQEASIEGGMGSPFYSKLTISTDISESPPQ